MSVLACADAGVTVMLAAAIERGLNDHEIGAITRFGIEHPAVRGVVLQPVTHSGRHIEFDPLTRQRRQSHRRGRRSRTGRRPRHLPPRRRGTPSLPDASFDAIVCECAFSTFPDKPTAAREFARVLRPGGRLGLTDITIVSGGLPDGLAGWIACLADARPLQDYVAILAAAGLHTTATEHHDGALARMVDQIDARLRAYRITARTHAALADVDIDRALDLTAQAAQAVRDGTAGYALLTAEKPGHTP